LASTVSDFGVDGRSALKPFDAAKQAAKVRTEQNSNPLHNEEYLDVSFISLCKKRRTNHPPTPAADSP